MEEFSLASCEELMKVLFGRKYLPEEGKPYCRREPINGKALPDQLSEILGTFLSSRNQKILIRCFEFKNGQKLTFDEIGQEFDLSGESIRQIS